jgi:hypothetical protein
MEFSDFEKEIVQILEKMPKSRSRNCFRSALRHLEKSQILLDVDLEMAAFRAITAEEEAASGLMHCLKEQRYPGANILNPRDHPQKHAVIAFLKAVSRMPAELQTVHGFQFHLELNKSHKKPKLQLAFRHPVLFPGATMRPEPPLGFLATTGDKPRSFAPFLSELAANHDQANFLSHIRFLANYRNRILYADESGVPVILEIPSGAQDEWKRNVFALLFGYLLIKPYKEHQLFVSQLLSSFLVALNKVPMGGLHPDA